MGRKNHSLIYQAQKILEEKLRIGISKHQIKISGEDFTRYIFSWSTYNSYMKHIGYFINFVREHQHELLGRKVRTIEECKAFVDRFIQYNIDRGLSSYTIKLQVSALAKLYSCHTYDFDIQTPARKRANIKRSRNFAEMDKHFSEMNQKNLVIFCKCSGLRRRELSQITGNDLFRDEKGIYQIKVTKGTKGGKPRITPIVYESQEELEAVIRLCSEAGNGKIFSKISSAADIHSYRRDYAKRYYNQIKRPISQCKNERLIIYKNRVVASYTSKNGRRNVEKFKHLYTSTNDLYQMLPGYRDVSSVYCCRRDCKSICYDRKAMFEVSSALGHNRESIIAGHYIT